MTQEELAKDWLSRASGKWRLQVLQRRGRNVPKGGDDWERRELPLRLRRFLNGTPVGLVHDVLRLLDTDVTLKDPVFNWEPAGTVSPDAEPDRYKPVRTYIVKDGNPNESNGKDPTYTIVQDLRLAGDDGDDLDVTDMSACAQESETRYVWDASDVESAPPGGQGVSWRVSNVTRDQETDLYSYQLRKEVAITQHQEPQVTECGEFETVTQESWDNLYGEPGSFRDQDNAPVNVPEPCDAPDGTTVRVQVSENPDCTFKAVVTKSVAKERRQVTEARKSLRGVTETVRTVATSPMPETGLELGEQVRNELRPDGKYDVTHVTASRESVGDIGSGCERTVFEHRHDEVRNEAERPEDEAGVAGGGRVYKVTSRATEEGTWDVTRSETTELRAEKARHSKRKTLRGVTETWTDRNVDDNDVGVADIGDEVVVEETPGGKWNRTVTRVSRESVGDVGSSCETTVFEHRHVESENVATRPEKEAGSAGGGRTYQVQARATEEGTWDVSRTVTEEKAVPNAQLVMRKTLRGVTETFVHRNVEDSSVSVTDIGDEVRVERTPGGRWNRTETHASHEAVGVIGKSCSATPPVHTDVTVSNVPDGRQPEPRHQVAEVNVEKTVETRRTEEGTWDVTERTATHQPWGEQKIAESENDSQKVEFHSFQNLTEVPPMTAGRGQSISANASRNGVGSFDGSFRIVTGKPWGEETVATASNETQDVEFHAFQNLGSAPAMTAGQGESITASVSRNELGLFDGSFRKVRGKGWGEETIATASNETQDVEFHQFQNLQSPPAMQAGQGESITASVSRNELGLFDGSFRKVRGKGWGEETIAFVDNAMASTEISQFQNLRSVPVKAGGNGVAVTASAGRNELGLFDGKFTVETAHPYDTGWITWDSKTVTANGTYWYHHGVRLFYNQGSPKVDGFRGSNVNVRSGMNRFGLFDGELSYSDLYDWTLDGSGERGGHRDGKAETEQTMVDSLGRVWRRKASVRTTHYWGTGNEASEAEVAVNQKLPAGLHLQGRTYANGEPEYTAWELDR